MAKGGMEGWKDGRTDVSKLPPVDIDPLGPLPKKDIKTKQGQIHGLSIVSAGWAEAVMRMSRDIMGLGKGKGSNAQKSPFQSIFRHPKFRIPSEGARALKENQAWSRHMCNCALQGITTGQIRAVAPEYHNLVCKRFRD